VVKLKMNDTNIYHRVRNQYFESETWKCGKSPAGAHHWIINGKMMRCKYCHEERLKA
jgi:hypothetical protein